MTLHSTRDIQVTTSEPNGLPLLIIEARDGEPERRIHIDPDSARAIGRQLELAADMNVDHEAVTAKALDIAARRIIDLERAAGLRPARRAPVPGQPGSVYTLVRELLAEAMKPPIGAPGG